MRNKIGIILYFLFVAGAVVVMFALVAGLIYLIAVDRQPISWNLVSGSLFFIILAGIFWVCGQAARHFLTNGGESPPNGNAST
ncbi:hypothetical protein HOP52_13445 [Halomonas campisalis]|uniref:Uncharacterized protein n=1 Tax=Billgrantia campisalis TaxID=74661 RepID=A0ABS9PAE3_9GAMM|nr:hypothetical protein [Halomonas campisalis]MCG6658759.1 hypothetical protein [Halomonas campisalis]MDR5864859.1 hypothetical protein [Halomonas campisalis]